jgi:hypothetical protein
MGIGVNVAKSGYPRTVNSYGVRYVLFLVKVGFEASIAILVPGPHERIAGNDLPTPLAFAIQPSQLVHRNYTSGRRAGNDRVAGPGVDREVMQRAVQPGRGRDLQ